MTSPKTNENSNTKKQLHLLHFFKLRNTFHEQSEHFQIKYTIMFIYIMYIPSNGKSELQYTSHYV